MRFLGLEADDLPEGYVMREMGDESLVGVSSVYSMDAKFMGYEQSLSNMLGRLQAYEQAGEVVAADFLCAGETWGNGAAMDWKAL